MRPAPVRLRDRAGGHDPRGSGERRRRRQRRPRGRAGGERTRIEARGDAAGRGRRGRRGRGRRAGQAEAVRRGHQGREGDGGPVPDLAEGRQDLAGDSARAARRAVLLLGQPELGHRREHVLRRPDGGEPSGRVPQGRHRGAAHRAQLALLRAAEDAAGAGRARGVLRQPARQRADPFAAASGAQVGAHRRRRAAARRHSGRERRARADLPPVVRVRRQALQHHPRAHDAGAHVVQCQRPLCAVAGGAAAGAARADAVHPAAGDDARHPQPVPRLVLQLREASGRRR